MSLLANGLKMMLQRILDSFVGIVWKGEDEMRIWIWTVCHVIGRLDGKHEI